jgi:hypothetical protein
MLYPQASSSTPSSTLKVQDPRSSSSSKLKAQGSRFFLSKYIYIYVIYIYIYMFFCFFVALIAVHISEKNLYIFPIGAPQAFFGPKGSWRPGVFESNTSMPVFKSYTNRNMRTLSRTTITFVSFARNSCVVFYILV